MCDVNVITGELVRFEVDLFLPGFIPFEFTRLYKSTRTGGGNLGRGWIQNYDMYLRREQQRVICQDTDGEELVIEVSSNGAGTETATQAITIEERETFLVIDRGGKQREYFHPFENGIWRPVYIEDINGNTIRFSYDVLGRERLITDTLGRQILLRFDSGNRVIEIAVLDPDRREFTTRLTYRYDRSGDLIAVHDRLGRTVQYEYQDHLLVRQIDRNGNSMYWAYDNSRRCVRTWRDGYSLLRELRRDPARHAVWAIDSLGHSTIYRFDEKQNITSETDPTGRVNDNIYDHKGDLTVSLDGSGGQEVSVFDDESNCLAQVSATGTVTQYFFDSRNRLIKVIDGDGNLSLKERDDKGRLIRSIAPDGAEWRFEYAPQGYVSKTVNPLGHTIYQNRSPDGRRVEVRDDLGLRLVTEYDLDANVTSITNAAGRITRFNYDAGNRLRSIVSPDGTVRRCEYDAENRRTRAIDEMGRVYQYEYNSTGQPVKEINPLGDSLEQTYDTEEHLISITNWKGEQSRLSYDAVGRPVERVLFDGRRERYQYENEIDPVAKYNSSGQVTHFEHHQRRLARIIYPGGMEFNYQRKAGRIASATDGTVSVVRQFDKRFRLIKETCDAWFIQFSYDSVDNLILVEDKAGRTVLYEYDVRRRLIQMEDSIQGRHEFSYNLLDLMTEWRAPNGLTQRMEYDDVDRLLKISVINASGTEVLRREFRYDSVDDLISERVYRPDLNEPIVNEYEYDPLHRLTRIVRNTAVSDWYEYDANSNIIRSSRLGRANVALGNRLLGAGEFRFDYDAEGNVVRRMARAGTTGYAYDAAGRLSEIAHPDGSVTRFTYDPFNRRIAKIHGDNETRYYWCNNTVFREQSDGGATEYLFLPGSFIPIGCNRNGRPEVFALDQIATPREAFDVQGSLVWSRDGDAFLFSAPPEFNMSGFGFQGQYHDSETGLYYNLHRYYDPSVARYMTQDPIGLLGGTNFYRYVTNPKSWIDPWGLFEIELSARCDWNQQQKDDFEAKVERYNQKIAQRQNADGEGGITIAPCARKDKSLSKEYEKCNKGDGNRPYKKSPKDQGKSVDCTDDIDHILDVQMGGAQEGPELCDNLTPVNASVNRSLGSQVRNQLKLNASAIAAGEPLEWVNIGQRDCTGVTERTPACV